MSDGTGLDAYKFLEIRPSKVPVAAAWDAYDKGRWGPESTARAIFIDAYEQGRRQGSAEVMDLLKRIVARMASWQT